MKHWFAQLNEREQQLVLLGAGTSILIILFVLYADFVSPMIKSYQNGEQLLAEKKADLDWMKDAVVQIQQARKQGMRTPTRGSQSLFALVDSTGKQANLSQAMKRVEPDGDQRVRIWLENASFDDAIDWLSLLQSQYQVEVSRMTVDSNASGQVNVSALLVETP
jgi:general secretion pathway protein M